MPYISFFFNDTATTEIYTLSLHDALPICAARAEGEQQPRDSGADAGWHSAAEYRRSPTQSAPAVKPLVTITRQYASGGFTAGDRKSTRLNSSHSQISYAVFCLKTKIIQDH